MIYVVVQICPGLMFFELVSVLFAIVSHYGNEYTTKENKLNQFEKFCAKTNFKPQHNFVYCMFSFEGPYKLMSQQYQTCYL